MSQQTHMTVRGFFAFARVVFGQRKIATVERSLRSGADQSTLTAANARGKILLLFSLCAQTRRLPCRAVDWKIGKGLRIPTQH